MGWKGAIRSYQAATRRNQREQIRREKAHLVQQAYNIAQQHSELLNSLLTFHHRVTDLINWDIIEPVEPKKTYEKEAAARFKYENFKPSFINKFLKNQQSVLENLKKKIEGAKISDELEYTKKINEFNNAVSDWKELQIRRELLSSINLNAIKEMIQEVNPFQELYEHGLEVRLRKDEVLIIECKMESMEFMKFYEVKLYERGGGKIKKMNKKRAREHGEDVCASIALKLAREGFNILPISSLIISIVTDNRDPASGKLKESIIYKARIQRSNFEGIDFEYTDPSTCLESFEILEQSKLNINVI